MHIYINISSHIIIILGLFTDTGVKCMRKDDKDSVFKKEKFKLILDLLSKQNYESGLFLDDIYQELKKDFSESRRVLDKLTTLKSLGLVIKDGKKYRLADKVKELTTLKRNISLLNDYEKYVIYALEHRATPKEFDPDILTYFSPSGNTQLYLISKQKIPERYHRYIDDILNRMESNYTELDKVFNLYERELINERVAEIKRTWEKRKYSKKWKRVVSDMAKNRIIKKPDMKLTEELEIKIWEHRLKEYFQFRYFTVVMNKN